MVEKESKAKKWKRQRLEQREHVKAMIAKFEAEKEAKRLAREIEDNPPYPKPHKFHPSKAMKADFYKSWEWRKLRNKAYSVFGHSCAQCNSSNKHLDMCGEKVRLVVDHIYPLHTHWHMRLDPSNVQVLCDECNMGKGAWDTSDHRELGDYGIPLEIIEQMRQE